jgi:processive 1,2-diacylglycerol beta-glucosyltransferase
MGNDMRINPAASGAVPAARVQKKGKQETAVPSKDTFTASPPAENTVIPAPVQCPVPPEFLEIVKSIPPWKHLKVLLVHGSHTGGHRSAAESVKAVLDSMPNVEARVVNTLDYSGGESVKNAQVAATDFVMSRMAPVRGWFFRRSFEGNPVVYWLGNTAMKLKSWACRSFLNEIKKEKPDIILSCHSPMNSLLSYWKGKGEIDAPVHSAVTDFRVHRMWAQENIDHYYVACEGAKKELASFGVDEEKIEVSGIPIKPDFAAPRRMSKAEARRKLGLDPDLPTVLMMGGSLGLGRFTETAKALSALGWKAQLVCITGKNEAKRRELEELKSSLSIPMKALGYVDKVSDWMDACDVIVSKPGGLTTSEIFAKKIPMIMMDPTPGLEEMLIPTIEKTGAAFTVSGPEEAARLIKAIVEDPSKKERVMRSLDKVGKPTAAYTVAGDLIRKSLEPPAAC